MNLSQSDIVLLHTRPSSTQLNLSIFAPTILMKCRVNNPAAQNGDRTIIYDSVSMGSYIPIESGFTLWIGTTDGGRDVGQIRIRSATSSQLVVSENNNIAWADNLFLTVLHYADLYPIYPRLINDPANVENVIFYKDYDIVYTNQNSILGTFPNAGPHRAAFLDPTAQLYWTATGSVNLAGASLAYNWNFEGGTPSGSTALTPGLVTYNNPGHYVTRLTISGSNGAVDVTYRYVSIYDRPGNGTGTVPARWQLTKAPDGSRSEGGHTATIRMYDINADLVEDAVVVLFTEDYYGSNKVSLGGNAQNSANIFFVGYILKNSIKYDYANSFVEFEIGSLTELMKQSLGFAISVQDDPAPDTWYKILNLNVQKSLYHYLRWHTTVLSLADVQFLGTDYPIQYFDSSRESMYDAVDNLMKSTLVGTVVSDRQGKIWAEVSAEATPNATGTFTQVMELTKQDWMNQPVLTENIRNLYSYLEYGGIAYSGISTGTYAPLKSNAPGNAPSFMGKIDETEGLALLDQIQLNQLVGNLWTNRNARFPQLDIDLVGKYSNLDIAPQETVHIPLQPSDTARRIQIEQLYIPDGMSWQWDEKAQVLYPKVTFKVVKSGNPGQTIPIPQIPDGGGFGGGPGVSRFNLPPLPAVPSFNFPGTGSSASTYFYAHFDIPTSSTLTTDTVITLPSPTWQYSSFSTGTTQYPPGIYVISAIVTIDGQVLASATDTVDISAAFGGGAGAYGEYKGQVGSLKIGGIHTFTLIQQIVLISVGSPIPTITLHGPSTGYNLTDGIADVWLVHPF